MLMRVEKSFRCSSSFSGRYRAYRAPCRVEEEQVKSIHLFVDHKQQQKVCICRFE